MCVCVCVQDPHALSAYLTSQSHLSTNFLSLMADFHLLFFLFTSDVAGIQMKVSVPTGHKLSPNIPPTPRPTFPVYAKPFWMEIGRREMPGDTANTGQPSNNSWLELMHHLSTQREPHRQQRQLRESSGHVCSALY